MSQTRIVKTASMSGPTIRTVPDPDPRESVQPNSIPPSPSTTHHSDQPLSPMAPTADISTPPLSRPDSFMARSRLSLLEPLSAPAPAPAKSGADDSAQDVSPSATWDSTIGKAGLGKTGRVINKLVDENETLKREIKIERLRAEEARQAAKLVEDKMDRSTADYESRLLEANFVRTLLTRKERQLEELTGTIERHRQRADAAVERERGWRDELEKTRLQSTQQVEAANTRAELMEGRYNVLVSQWGSQEAAVQKLRAEIQDVADERRRDDERIATLRDVCEQQDSNIRQLRAAKDKIGDQFEAYKRAQEDGLKHIKDKARQQEADQERLLEETRQTLHKLRWALAVKENVADAQ